jgi:hypothetical protein
MHFRFSILTWNFTTGLKFNTNCIIDQGLVCFRDLHACQPRRYDVHVLGACCEHLRGNFFDVSKTFFGLKLLPNAFQAC